MSMDQLERRLGPIPNTSESNNPFVEAMENEDMSQFEEDLASPDAAESFEDQEPVDRATSRVGRMLQNMSDRIENGSVYADNASERAAELKEKASAKIKGFGRSALTRLKTAGTITLGLGLLGAEAGARGAKKGYEATVAGAKKSSEVMGDKFIAGLKATERGMDSAAASVSSRVDTFRTNRETKQFNRQTERDRKESAKEYAEQVKQLEADAKAEQKALDKQAKIDSKEGAREDKRFERSMKKKAALERKAERRARWSSNYNALKNTMKDGVEIAANTSKDLYESGRDKASELSERAKTKARVSKVAAKMALQTYRDTKEAFKS